MSSALMKSLTESIVLKVASRLMMAVGLPMVSVLYFFIISKPLSDLAERIAKVETSDFTQHDQLLKQELVVSETNKSLGGLNDAIKDFSGQLRELNSYLAIQKDRDARELRGVPK
jgi:methyl-accepting chemotaxis protein